MQTPEQSYMDHQVLGVAENTSLLLDFPPKVWIFKEIENIMFSRLFTVVLEVLVSFGGS